MTSEDLTSLSVSELFSLALTTSYYDDGDSPGWRAIWELRRRGTEEIFTLSKSFCQSDDPHNRAIGADVLGYLGWENELPFREQCLPILFHMTQMDSNIEVLNSVCVVLGHLHDERAIEHLLKLKSHSDEDVRFGVTFGLLGYEDEHAIDALIELSKDSDSDVRDWATFGLGQQIDVDTEAIRQALYERLDDTNEDTQDEAIIGLALRKDERLMPFLLARFEQHPNWILPFEAAEVLADPRLLPALYRFRDHWTKEKNWKYHVLEDAIAACEGRQREE
ncbi:MAG: HEAT repeat domain-containing protein [Chloroflexota bacterium]